MLLDAVEYSALSIGHRSLVMLSMTNKETKERISSLLKKLFELEQLFKLGSVFRTIRNKGLMLFDPNGRPMTIRCIEKDILKVCVAGVSYVLVPGLFGASCVSNPSGYRWYPPVNIGDILPLIIRDLKPNRDVMTVSRRLRVSVKKPEANMWYEIDDDYDTFPGRLYIRIHVDFKRLNIIVNARNYFNRNVDLRNDGRDSGKGAKICMRFRCVQFS